MLPTNMTAVVATLLLFAAVNLGALVYLVGWELAAISLFIVPVSNEIARGNIHLLLGLAIVVGFRYPAIWAWPLLTKARDFCWQVTALTGTASLAVLYVVAFGVGVAETCYDSAARAMLPQVVGRDHREQ